MARATVAITLFFEVASLTISSIRPLVVRL